MSLVLLIPIILLSYFYYRQTIPVVSKKQKILLLTLRVITIFSLVVLLFNPILRFWLNRETKEKIVILHDNSISMDLPLGELSKSEYLSSYLTDIESEISSYDLKRLNFADGIEGDTSSASINKTLQQLSDFVSLNEVKQIILVSDGWFNDEDLSAVSRINIPISTIQPDYEEQDFDLGIDNIKYNSTAYTEEEITILADIFAEKFSGKAELILSVDGVVVEKKTVDFKDNPFQTIQFSRTFNETGLYRFSTEIIALNETENNNDNNAYPGAIKVIESRIGTYLLTDKLNWDVRFINNALRRDDRKEVKVFVSKNGIIYQDRDTVPFQEVLSSHLQTLFIYNYGSLRLSNQQLELLKRFSDNGGGIVLTGLPVRGMEDIFAASESGITQNFRGTFFLTNESKKYQTFSNVNASEIPPVEYYYVNPQMQAQILARINNDEQSPAIIYNDSGKGKSLYFSFFNFWRWQLRTGSYNKFIDDITSWIANPAGIDFIAQTDQNSYLLGEKVNVKLTAYDETLNINPNLNPLMKLINEDEEVIKEDFLLFDSQHYTTSLEQLPSGHYSYHISDSQTGKSVTGEFIVSNIGADARNKGFNLPLLSYITRQTGGQTIGKDSSIDLPTAQKISTRIRIEYPIYRHWLMITLFLIVFCTELFLRKKWGLL